MPDELPPAAALPPAAGRGNLVLRVVSAAALAPLAIGAVYVGGWPFILFWLIAGIGVLWEWSSLTAGENSRKLTLPGALALALAAVLLGLGRLEGALAIVGLAVVLAAARSPTNRPGWDAAGVLYAGTLVIAPVLLRSDPEWGAAAILFLFAVVWSTDIVAYFAGRLLGGPKLWPRVSPKKTWSGAIVGTLAAVLAGIATARAVGIVNWAGIAGISLALSIVSQAGDFLESAIKRKFGAKDASQLIPGHGGLMDRLDGFLTAVIVAVLLGVWRGGLEAPARGLLIW